MVAKTWSNVFYNQVFTLVDFGCCGSQIEIENRTFPWLEFLPTLKYVICQLEI
jgi:hypothetical protein